MNVKTTYPLKDLYGRPLGWIEEDYEGNRQIKNSHLRIVGFYNKQRNRTTDFYGRYVGEGDLLTTLLNR